MSDETQSEPVMDGSTDATEEQQLAGLIEQVEADHGEEGPGAMADALRDRLPETESAEESPADAED